MTMQHAPLPKSLQKAGAKTIRLRFDGNDRRHWHLDLLQRLAARPGTAVSFDDRPGLRGLGVNGLRFLAVEGLVHRHRAGLSRSVGPESFAAFASAPAGPVDLVIDLCGDFGRDGPPVWHLSYDGLAGGPGLLGAMLAGRAPVASLRTGAGGPVSTARLGTEGSTLRGRFDDYLAGTTALIVASLDGTASADLPLIEGETPPIGRSSDLSFGDFAFRSAKLAARMAARRFYDVLYDSPQWRTGWRWVDGPDLYALRDHPGTGWNVLPDDGQRFYADPFPILRGGQVTLFVEDFHHGLGRGVISAVRFGPTGPVGSPEVVLDTGHHLSYPFVFEADGETWMIPESCSVGRVDLFRAKAFPGDWVLETTLIEDLVVSDATIHRRGETWWMFGCVREGGGSFSDHLHLWTAADFRGPWIPHAANPVLVDIASARPAGRMVERDGTLFRPVQDCRDGYGAALGIARVTELDHAAFGQVVETIVRPGPNWPGRRLHTLNAAGGFEFIDGSGAARWGNPGKLNRRRLNR